MIFKGCGRCHGDIGKETYSYLGVKHVEYYCLLCARIWDESKLLDMLRTSHIECCSKEQQDALIVRAVRVVGGYRVKDLNDGRA